MKTKATVQTALASSWVAYGRILFGLFWLYEATIGHNWKVGNPKWFGEGAGTWLREDIANAVATGTWGWAQVLLETTVVPYAAFWGYIVTALQLAIGLSLVLGLFTRPVAAVGLAHMPVMFMTGHSRIPPFFAAGFLVVLATQAGMNWGLDVLLVVKLERIKAKWAKFAAWAVHGPLPDWSRRCVAIPLAAAGAMFFLLQIAALDSGRFRMASLGLAWLLASVAVGLALANTMDRTALVGRLVGAFVGFKFLHEIWIRSTPALNGLPGWASAEQLAEPFRLVAERHFAPLAWAAENVFVSFAGVWLVVFGVVQFSVGLALILGWRTRLASKVGMGYLALLLVMGFARYTPFIFGLLIIAYALGGENRLSLDAESAEDARAWPPPALGKAWLAGASAIVLAAVVLVAVHGIIPGDYRERMGSATAAMVAMMVLPLAAAAAFQAKAHRAQDFGENANDAPVERVPQRQKREQVGV